MLPTSIRQLKKKKTSELIPSYVPLFSTTHAIHSGQIDTYQFPSFYLLETFGLHWQQTKRRLTAMVWEALGNVALPSLSNFIFCHSLAIAGYPGVPQTSLVLPPSFMQGHLGLNPSFWTMGFFSALRSHLKWHLLKAAFSTHLDPVTLYSIILFPS